MPEEENVQKKRSVRSVEERVEEIDKKIADYENKIDVLREKREALLHPLTYNDVIKQAKQQKITPKKLAEMINLDQSQED